MKKSFFRKGASALLAVVMCLSSFLGIGATTAFAAEEVSDTVVMFSFPREGDANFSGNWGHGDLQYMNGWSAGASSKITVYTVGSWSGNACYCIEPGTPLAIGDTMTKRDETYWDNYPSAYNKTISADEIKMWIGRIFQYGYTGNVDIDWRSQNAADADKMAHVNKAFQSGMGGYSIYGYCMDGSDPCVRLEQYMAVEHGGRNGWQIERCYIKEDVRQMIDIIAGPCFICDCSGSDFGSLSDEQLKRYVEQFKYPEHFFRTENGIKAIPYPPEKNQER